MPSYIKKPVKIEAEKYTGANAADILFWMGSFHTAPGPRKAELTDDGKFVIHTLEGDHTGTPGDWVIRGVKGEFYFCKPDIFEMTYDRA